MTKVVDESYGMRRVEVVCTKVSVFIVQSLYIAQSLLLVTQTLLLVAQSLILVTQSLLPVVQSLLHCDM